MTLQHLILIILAGLNIFSDEIFYNIKLFKIQLYEAKKVSGEQKNYTIQRTLELYSHLVGLFTNIQ